MHHSCSYTGIPVIDRAAAPAHPIRHDMVSSSQSLLSEGAVMKLMLFLTAVSICLCSCTDPFSPPVSKGGSGYRETLDSLPQEPLPLDLDDDGTPDASVLYRTLATTDYPTSSMSTMIRIESAGMCEFLYEVENGYRHFERGEVIPMPSVPMLRTWYDHGVDVASIGWQRERGWEKEWQSEWTGTGRYLPFRLGTQGAYRYGWLEISVDIQKGHLFIHDQYCSPVAGQEVRAGEK